LLCSNFLKGGTYAGNAVSCAAANATFDVIKEENLLQNVNERGQQLSSKLKKLKEKYKFISEVRGLGLMIGMEFDPKLTGIASSISKECAKNGMLLLTTSCFEALRFIPPLNVTKDEIDMGFKIFEKSLDAVAMKL
jgi:4-aminobutyrate aminotransferase